MNPTQEVQPLLALSRTAEWLEVTPELIAKARKDSLGRLSTMDTSEVIPCGNFCGQSRVVGEQVLVVHFNGEKGSRGKGTKRDRYFCGVVCQRQNYTENPDRFRRRSAS
jgi:hypothetical protein